MHDIPSILTQLLRIIALSYADYRGRQDLYKKGGLVSVTSRILVVDMLQSDMPTELISGLLVLHAERYVDVFLRRHRVFNVYAYWQSHCAITGSLHCPFVSREEQSRFPQGFHRPT